MAYNLLFPVQVFTNVAMSANRTSEIVEIKNQDNIGVQLVWTGAPVGTFDVQISMTYQEDQFGNVTDAGTWTSLPLSPSITAAGSADNAYIDLNQMSAMYVRVVYTRVSGTGTLNGFVDGKGV